MADNTNPYGVDLAIDPNTGDLVGWPNGALGVKDGPTNALQAMLLWVKTTPGELPLHPDFGSVFQGSIGGKFNIVAIDGLARSEFKNILAQDARFLSVGAIVTTQIDGLSGPKAHISATLYLTGGEKVEVLDLAQGVFSPTIDQADLDPSPADPMDDPSFFTDDLDADDLADVDTAASAVEDLDLGIVTPSDL